MKKRIVTVFLAVTMAFSLTACGSADSGKKSAAEDTEEEDEEEADEEEEEDEEKGDGAEEAAEDKDADAAASEEEVELPEDLLERFKTEKQETSYTEGDLFLPEGPAEWKDIYLGFLDELEKSMAGNDYDNINTWQFGFIYVNEDDIPELVASSGYEAAGNQLVTVIDGKACAYQTARLCFYYADHGNMVDNSDGNSGYYYDNFFRIGPNGWEDIIHGEWMDAVYTDEAEPGEDYAFRWNEEHVSEQEYLDHIADMWGGKDKELEKLQWQHGVDVDSMRAYLSGNVAGNAMEAYSELLQSGFGDGVYTEFSLVFCNDADPELIARGKDKMCVVYWENGLLEIGPDWYIDTYNLMVSPWDGMIRSQWRGDADEASDSVYWMRSGSLFQDYYDKRAKRDGEWNILTDAAGNTIYMYYHKGREITQQEYEKVAAERDALEMFAITDSAVSTDVPLLDFMSREDMITALATGTFG